MNKYVLIWIKMKPNIWYTAKELETSPASMTAMSKRNMVVIKDTYPKQYCKIKNMLINALYLADIHASDMTDYVDIYRSGDKLPMLCSIKESNIYDCYEKLFDVSNAISMRIGRVWYDLNTGKEKESYE